MPDFKSLKDLEKYLNDNPKIFIKQNIGKKIKNKCPICKTIQQIKLLSEDKGRCLGCNESFNIKFTSK